MASQEIPSDIVFEILTRTKSLTTLEVCKSVCKEWNQMIRGSNFMQAYNRRSKTPPHFTPSARAGGSRSMFVSLDGERRNSDQSDAVSMADDVISLNVGILASCNQGLLCCVKKSEYHGGSEYGYRYYVCKPATNQWQPLPNPKARYHALSVSLIVLSSTPLRYKIVRLSMDLLGKSRGQVRLNGIWHSYHYCELFDSKIWKWRQTQPLVMPDRVLYNSSLVVSRTNSVYWLAFDDVIQFDYVQECYNKIPLLLPLVKNDVYYDHHYKSKLVDYQGRLGLTCMKERCKVELWLIKNVEKGKWRKKTVIDIGNLEELVRFPDEPHIGFYNGEVALTMTRDEVVFYRASDRHFGKTELRNGVRGFYCVFQFRSDFELVNLKGAFRD